MKAVVFDFNGTLFDDTRFHKRAWKQFMLQRFNLDFTPEEIHKRFIGPSNSDIFHGVFGDRYSEAEINEFVEEKEAIYRAVAMEKEENMHLIEGANELFDLLVERNIPFALATSSALPNVNFYLNDLGLNKWFSMDRVVYDDGRLATKPDPAFYLEAARLMGVDASEMIIVEDSPSGIQAAVNAKAGRIIAVDRTAPRDWLEANKNIHAIIHDFHGFEKFL